MKKILQLLLISTVVLFWSCAEETNVKFDRENFFTIYDHNQFDSAFFPIDTRQTSDGGYLTLAKRKTEGDFHGVYLLKADQNGAFVSSTTMPDDFANPLPALMKTGNEYAFFCMNATSKVTQLVKTDETGAIVSTQDVPVSYPCAVSMDSSNVAAKQFVLLSYNHVDRRTVVSTVSMSGEIQNGIEFNIGIGGEDEVEESIINHFFQYGRKLPFFTGRLPGGLYYFNGFYNYTFSLSFTNLSDDEPNSILQGQHDEGGITAAMHLSGNLFAAARFNFGDNYFLPSRDFNLASSPQSSVDLGGFKLAELVTNAPVRIVRMTIENRPVIVFASDTKSKQIGLWFYDASTGAFISSRYIGFSNPFEIGGVIQTNDGGLIVSATTYIAGRFPRIALVKISKQELSQQNL